MKRKMKKAAAFALLAGALTAANSMTAFAGAWQKDAKGWWYQKDDGSYYKNEWQWIDGNNDGTAECYYFGADGYILVNTTTPDGYTVNGDGAWVENGAVKTQGNTQTVQNGTMIQAGGFILESDPAFADFNLLCRATELQKSWNENPLELFQIMVKPDGHSSLDCFIRERNGMSDEEIKKTMDMTNIDNFGYWALPFDLDASAIKEYSVNGNRWFGTEKNGRISVITCFSNRIYNFDYNAKSALGGHQISIEDFIKKIKFTEDFSAIFINADGEIEKNVTDVNEEYRFQLKK